MGTDRFSFGKNWLSFVEVLDEDRLQRAEDSLRELLGVDTLEGKTFLDIGSGSGLFSLAAHRLGAARIHSFDLDLDSVSATRRVRQRFAADSESWHVERGDVLDAEYMRQLGTWDVVYSWGVLHHTGSMWSAIDSAASRSKDNGTLAIALYNDQGWRSRFWKRVKRTYCSGVPGKLAVCGVFISYYTARMLISSVKHRKNQFRAYRRHRGMSAFHDWFDWLGGYPFEVASTEEVDRRLSAAGFELCHLIPAEGLGNNQFRYRQRRAVVTAA